VVAQDRDHGQPRRREQRTRRLGFEDAAALRDITGNKQEIGTIGDISQSGDRLEIFGSPNMKIASRRDANPPLDNGISLKQ
jgi:hypothetical protein